MRYFNEDDTFDEKGAVKGGVRARMVAMDGSVIPADGNPLSLHKPGFRYSTDRALQDSRDRAYNEMVRRTENAWKSEARRIADTERAAEPPVCEDAREDAYQRYKNWLANAWRAAR